MKKFIAICMAITLIIAMMPSSVASAAVKISKPKATMEVDSTLKLKLSDTKGTVKWASSKKSVATVSSSGSISAKSEGNAVITATVRDKTYTCKLTVVNSNKKVIVMGVGDTAILSKGIYIVGEDIDVGKYNLKVSNDWCRLRVYENEDSESSEISEQLIADESPIYSNLKLKDGNKLEITYNAVVEFTRIK